MGSKYIRKEDIVVKKEIKANLPEFDGIDDSIRIIGYLSYQPYFTPPCICKNEKNCPKNPHNIPYTKFIFYCLYPNVIIASSICPFI